MTPQPETGQPPDGRPALRRCVAGDPEEFASSYWGSRALLSYAADLARAPGLPNQPITANPVGPPELPRLPDLPTAADLSTAAAAELATAAGAAAAGRSLAAELPPEPLSAAEDAGAAEGLGGFSDLFSLDAADELLSRRGLRTPFLRIAKNGSVVGDGEFTGAAGVGAEIGDQVRDDKVAALFTGGHTVVLQALHRTWPPLVDFATQLSAEASHPVQINAYITPAESQGFSAHYDVHDVFVLQVAGEKHWTVHEPVHVDPLRNQPWTDHSAAVATAARDHAPVVDAVLRPGDALYVPRGFLHSAKALGGVSVHLTVGLHTMTRYLLVQELAALAANQVDLRAALPLGFDPGDPAQVAQQLEKVVPLLVEQIRSASADELAVRLRRRTWSGNRPAPLPPLAHAAAIASLAVGTTVRLRAGLRYRLVQGDPVLLQLVDRTISLPAATSDAVARLCSGDEIILGDLPDLDEADQLVLVRRLMTEAVVVASPQ